MYLHRANAILCELQEEGNETLPEVRIERFLWTNLGAKGANKSPCFLAAWLLERRILQHTPSLLLHVIKPSGTLFFVVY